MSSTAAVKLQLSEIMGHQSAVKLQLSEIVGHQSSVTGNLAFIDDNSLFYLSGRIGVFHDLKKMKSQKIFNISEDNQVTAVAVGLDNLLAVATKGESPSTSVFNLKMQVKTILPKPEEISSKEYVALSFSADNELLGAQGSSPDWVFVIWRWNKKRIDAVFNPFRIQIGAEVYKFAFCPEDHCSVVAVGKHFLRFYRLKENMKVHENPVHQMERSHLTFYSITWLNYGASQVAIGTSDGDILVFEDTRLIQKVALAEQMSSDGIDENKSITVLLSFTDGIFCSYGSDSVLMLTCDFKIIKTLKIPDATVGSYVTQLTLNKEYVAATTKDGRILSYCFAEHSQDNLTQDELHVLQDFQHTKTVLCADTAKHVPLLITCSSSTLLLRDVNTGKVLIRNQLDSLPQSISLHPLGISVALSFEKEVKLFKILHNSLIEEKSFEKMMEMSQIAFAPSGHLLAFTDGKHINLFYSIGFKKLTPISAHHNDVQMIVWRNDNFLVSLDIDGTLYEWDVLQKKQLWRIEIHNVNHTCLAVPFSNLGGGQKLYLASSDQKIRLIQSGCLHENIASTTSKVTALAVFEDILIAGMEMGSIIVFSATLCGPFFESQCHAAPILHISKFGSTFMAIGADGILSSWMLNGDKKIEFAKTLEVVLCDLTDQENINNRIDELEDELQSQVRRTNESRLIQTNELQSELNEATEKCNTIETSLQTVVMRLKKEIEEIKKNYELSIYNKQSIIQKEMKENDDDFIDKLLKEEEFLQQAVNERMASEKALRQKIDETIKEKLSCKDAFEQRYSRHKDKIHDLEAIIEQEQMSRLEIKRECEDIFKRLEDKKTSDSQHQATLEASDAQEENACKNLEIEEANKLLSQEKDRGRTLDEEFKRKQETYVLLQDRARQIAQKVDQVKTDVSRMNEIISEKGDMNQTLEQDVTELSVETEDHLQEYEKDQKAKDFELFNLKRELQECRDTHKVRTIQLQRARREEVTLNERLMATENSVKENAKQLFAAELLLERCRQEFASLTADCHTKASLRRVLLKLYDKRVLKAKTKNETIFDADINPYTNFYRQRDHYESLINIVRSRTSRIKETFRENYVKLAKENSDWTSFAESLRSDIRQYKTRIQALEAALGMPSDQFRLDPVETRKRLEEAATKLSEKGAEEEREIERRLAISRDQEEEIRRLHGLLTVGEKGRKIRRMPR